ETMIWQPEFTDKTLSRKTGAVHPSETMIWQPEFTDKTLSRKPGAVHPDAGVPAESLSGHCR
ncbi:TPA: hypothetical protein ACV18R_004515, partial [Escherichia coli]